MHKRMVPRKTITDTTERGLPPIKKAKKHKRIKNKGSEKINSFLKGFNSIIWIDCIFRLTCSLYFLH